MSPQPSPIDPRPAAAMGTTALEQQCTAAAVYAVPPACTDCAPDPGFEGGDGLRCPDLGFREEVQPLSKLMAGGVERTSADGGRRLGAWGWTPDELSTASGSAPRPDRVRLVRCRGGTAMAAGGAQSLVRGGLQAAPRAWGAALASPALQLRLTSIFELQPQRRISFRRAAREGPPERRSASGRFPSRQPSVTAAATPVPA